jgi:hypothetical protein
VICAACVNAIQHLRNLDSVEEVKSESFAGVVGPDWEFHTSKPGCYLIVPLIESNDCVCGWVNEAPTPQASELWQAAHRFGHIAAFNVVRNEEG